MLIPQPSPGNVVQLLRPFQVTLKKILVKRFVTSTTSPRQRCLILYAKFLRHTKLLEYFFTLSSTTFQRQLYQTLRSRFLKLDKIKRLCVSRCLTFSRLYVVLPLSLLTISLVTFSRQLCLVLWQLCQIFLNFTSTTFPGKLYPTFRNLRLCVLRCMTIS